jgi:putative ATPase
MVRRSQRLYKLVDWSGMPAGLAEQVEEAEEGIYIDPDDPLVNWDLADLERLFIESGFEEIQLQADKQLDQRRIQGEQLDRWFGAGSSPSGKISYSGRLSEAGLSKKEVNAVEKLYRRKLRGQIVTWRSEIAYLLARG